MVILQAVAELADLHRASLLKRVVEVHVNGHELLFGKQDRAARRAQLLVIQSQVIHQTAADVSRCLRNEDT